MNVQRSPPKQAAPVVAGTSPAATATAAALAASHKQSPNVTVRKQSDIHVDEKKDKKLEAFIKAIFTEFESRQVSRFNQIEENMRALKIQNDRIQASNTDIEKAVTDVSERIKIVQNDIERIEKDCKQLCIQVAKIENRCEALEKNLKKTSVEIRNVPKVKNETKKQLYSYIENFHSSLGLQPIQSNYRDIYRLPSRKDKDHANSSIGIEFVNTYTKGQFLDALTQRYNEEYHLTASILGMENNQTEIYVSDLLTPMGRRLLYLARSFKTEEGYAFCWTTGGNIYLKQAEGSLPILVRSEEQLVQLRQKKRIL
ncbi:hypothetical protein O0L34_g19230 [Tuta absoluta]|nr:hypothetical protein O0L34_g19230 [Tuta absoluta]